MLKVKTRNQKRPHCPSFAKPLKWTWSLRNLQQDDYKIVQPDHDYLPQAGDIVVVEVVKIGNHGRIYSAENKYIRLYQGDLIVGAMGFRYATDAFHADRLLLDKLHLLTNSGLLGTVTGRHTKTNEPTLVKVVGVLNVARKREQANLKKVFFKPARITSTYPPVVFVVGTGMNSGKTTSTARVGKSLVDRGLSVSVLKVTGSVTNRDLFEFEALGAKHTSDFSDYGFASTYLCEAHEMEALFFRMIEDTLYTSPDIILVEIADGILQRETQMLLKSRLVKSTAVGLVLTAPCSLSAFALVRMAHKLKYNPIALTGIITNSPLFVEEFRKLDRTPIIDTQNSIHKIGDLIVERIAMAMPQAASQL